MGQPRRHLHTGRSCPLAVPAVRRGADIVSVATADRPGWLLPPEFGADLAVFDSLAELLPGGAEHSSRAMQEALETVAAAHRGRHVRPAAAPPAQAGRPQRPRRAAAPARSRRLRGHPHRDGLVQGRPARATNNNGWSPSAAARKRPTATSSSSTPRAPTTARWAISPTMSSTPPGCCCSRSLRPADRKLTRGRTACSAGRPAEPPAPTVSGRHGSSAPAARTSSAAAARAPSASHSATGCPSWKNAGSLIRCCADSTDAGRWRPAELAVRRPTSI